MAAATTQVNSLGRGPSVYGDVSVFEVTVTATATTYTTATGGLPFDLTTALQTISATALPGGQAPNYDQTVNPNDIVCILPFQMSTNGYLPFNFALGTPTYTAIPWQSDSGPAATPGALTTCPCTVRLWGTGSANAAAFAEIGNGSVTDTFTFLIYLSRNGANS
jgi:hypothetical protein